MELSEREIALITYHRMTPAEQVAERKRLQDAAYAAALARLSPANRILAEQRKADSLAAIEAEKVRLAAMSSDEREAERAIKQKAAAEATLANLPKEVVDKVSQGV
jgi:hypothetical protein